MAARYTLRQLFLTISLAALVCGIFVIQNESVIDWSLPAFALIAGTATLGEVRKGTIRDRLIAISFASFAIAWAALRIYTLSV